MNLVVSLPSELLLLDQWEKTGNSLFALSVLSDCMFLLKHVIMLLEDNSEDQRMDENSSFIFTRYFKTVSVYDFKLSCLVSSTSICERIFQNDFLAKTVLADVEISLINSI